MIYSLSILTLKSVERRVLCQKKIKILKKLAWRLLCHNCANILNYLKKILRSPEFVEKHRNSSTAFTRNRKLPFHLLFCFIINFVKGSYQAELDRFFQAITSSSIAKRAVSKAAFAKARMKLKYEAFIELNQCLVNEFYAVFRCRTWHGFQLLAIDGTTLTLPKISEISEHFGVWNGRQGEPCPKARASQLYDPLNHLTVNAVINPKGIGERQQAKHLLPEVLVNSLILLDRGYPAFWLFKLIHCRHGQFCARISRQWKEVRHFINSGKNEKVIEFKAGAAAKDCKELGLDIEPMKLRLLRVELSSGEIEVLITSLIDKTTYPHNIFCDLYHARWPVEEDYKAMKCRIEMEAFTGKTALSVYQDFYANVFAKNLVAMLSYPARVALDTAGVKEKHVHQINFTQALGKAKNLVALLFQRTSRTIKKLIQEFIAIVLQTTEPVRPGRKYPRNIRIVKKAYYQNYKPIC